MSANIFDKGLNSPIWLLTLEDQKFSVLQRMMKFVYRQDVFIFMYYMKYVFVVSITHGTQKV